MRRCLKCGAEITACFGSVLARDVVRAMDGEIPYTSVREHCGKCVTKLIAHEYGDIGSREETFVYLSSIPELIA